MPSLEITDDLDLTGPGSAAISVNANQKSQVIYVDDDIDVSISGLTITGGKLFDADRAAGIENSQANLTILNSVVSDNAGIGGRVKLSSVAGSDCEELDCGGWAIENQR